MPYQLYLSPYPKYRQGMNHTTYRLARNFKMLQEFFEFQDLGLIVSWNLPLVQ